MAVITPADGSITVVDNRVNTVDILLEPNPHADYICTIKKGFDSDNLVVIDAGAGKFLTGRMNNDVQVIGLAATGESVTYQWNADRVIWERIEEIFYPYREFWQATPIVDINGATIQWTFVPVFTGQTPILVSYAAGVFTFLVPLDGNMKFDAELDHVIAANNADVTFSITPVNGGTGVDFVPRLVGSSNSPRAATFPNSAGTSGAFYYDANDTLQWDCASTGTNGSTVNLTSAVLEFEF